MNSEKYVIKHASEFSAEERNKFKEIVLSTGEVTKNTFDNLMNKNPVLLFFPNTSVIDAIGALKIPNDGYKTGVFEKSKTEFLATDFKYELGWIVSLKERKGNGKLITKILSDFKPKIYSTVRVENIGMNKILNSLGFIKTGEEYKSTRGNYYNQLYIKNNKNVQ